MDFWCEEKTLESIYEQWQPVNFELKAWKDTETYIVAGGTVDEMQSLMDDHIIKVQTMKGALNRSEIDANR